MTDGQIFTAEKIREIANKRVRGYYIELDVPNKQMDTVEQVLAESGLKMRFRITPVYTQVSPLADTVQFNEICMNEEEDTLTKQKVYCERPEGHEGICMARIVRIFKWRPME